MSKTSERAREALKDIEDEAKDLGRRGERALRHGADGMTDMLGEQIGRPVNRDYMRVALVAAIIGAVVLVVAGVRALFG